MNTVTPFNALSSESYLSRVASPKPQVYQSGSTAGDAMPVDQVDISHPSAAMHRQASETGRIALNAEQGNLTSDQAAQLYQQVASIQAQIAADKQAGGGSLSAQDAQAINELQSQLSAAIYTDAHNGAAPPTQHAPVDQAVKREAFQAGRIELNVQAGNLSSSQAQQLTQQQDKIDQLIASDKQANGGSLTDQQAQKINFLQDQASRQIYQFVHGVSPDDTAS